MNERQARPLNEVDIQSDIVNSVREITSSKMAQLLFKVKQSALPARNKKGYFYAARA